MPFGARLVEPRKGREQPCLLLVRQPRAVIAYPETEFPTPHYIKAQLYAWWLAAIFDGVAEIVDSHLFNPRTIAQRRRPRGGVGHDDLGLPFSGQVGQALLGSDHDARHIQRLHLDLCLAHPG